MSSRARFLWNRFSRIRVNYRTIPIALPKIPKQDIAVPCTVGFTLFTWLGFDKKLNAEDDLIHTIKHCVLFIQRTDYEKAEQLLHVALRQAQQMNHQLGITYVYDVMANLALEREQLDKAKKLFVAVSQRIMADGATEDDYRIVHIGVKLARISHLKKEYDTAQLGYDWCIQKLNNALAIDPTAETKKLLAMAKDWYGRLFLECNQCEHGLDLMLSSLELMKEVPDIEPEHIVIQINDIGTVYDKLGKVDEGIAYFKKAIEMGKELKIEDLGAMYVNLGRAYLKQNLIVEARKSCGQGWKLGVLSNNKDTKDEAESCLKQIKSMS